MNQDKTNPFVGLRSYQTADAAVFHGRDRQVDELLAFIQTTKFIAILGSAGCGKTSLIQAGLFPALNRGHNGVAGTEWVVCRTRPGCAPIKNLAYTLGGNGILDPSVKSTPETSLRIETMIRESNTGIVDAYARSPIAGKKNLLVFVDQLEDIFQYQKYYSSGMAETNEQHQYLNNLLRAALSPDLAIYVIVSLRSEFIGDLSQYRRLQEEVNQRDYLVPRLRLTEIKDIIAAPLASVGYSASPTVIDQLQKDIGSDIRKLPNLQFLLYQCFDSVRRQGTTILECRDVEAAGGIDQCFSIDLERHYESLSKPDKAVIERIFRSITGLHSAEGFRNPEKFRNICHISGVDKNDLTRFLVPFTSAPRQYLEAMPLVIPTVDTSTHQVFSEDHVLSIHNENIFYQWSRLHGWMTSEKESVEMYTRLVGDSVRFAVGSTGYLRPPDLNMAIKWREEQKPTEAWAERYHSDFGRAMQYIDASEKTYNDEIEAKENAQKEEIRSYRKRNAIIIIISIAVLLVVSALYVKAHLAGNEARKQAAIALGAQEIAKKEANQAKLAEQRANNEADAAEAAKEMANRKALDAQNAKKQEEIAKQNAIFSLEEALMARQQAVSSKSEAVAAKEMAQFSLVAEQQARIDADNRQKMAMVDKELFVLEHEFERADNTAPLVERLKVAYDDYGKYSTRIYGAVVPNNQLQKLLNEVQVKLLHSSTYAETPMKIFQSKKGGLRKMAISPNGTIAAGGDEGVVYLASGNKVTSWNIGLRIRTLLFLDDKMLLVGTFTGEIVRLKIADGSKETLFQYHGPSSNILTAILPGKNPREVTLIGAENIVRLNVDSRKTELVSINQPVFAAYLHQESSTILFSTSKGLYQLPDKGSPELLLDFSKRKSITAITCLNDKLVLGLKSGVINVYPLDKLFQKGLAADDFSLSFLEHKSEVTSLFYEPKDKKLFSSSLDNTVKIYDFGLGHDIEKFIVTLEGHKQWVWSLGYYSAANANDSSFLLTADEGGNLLKWYGNKADQMKYIDDLQKSQ